MKLNQRVVDGPTLPEGKSAIIYWDDECPGLGARLQGGARRWVVRYRVAGDPKQKQVTLGPLMGMPLKNRGYWHGRDRHSSTRHRGCGQSRQWPQGGGAGIYNRASYAEEKKRALQRWAEHVSGIVGEDGARVVVELEDFR